MINKDALVLYKGKAALVNEIIDGKYSISPKDGEQVKVRDKDIELLHPGPIKNFSVLDSCNPFSPAVKESWELLLEEEEAGLNVKELAGFIYNEYTPSSAYAVYCLLCDGLYFTGTIESIKLRKRDELAAEENKRNEKQREAGERNLFLEQVKICVKKSANGSEASLPADLLSKWAPFFQDIEALAYGKSAKSRTMRELDLGETPEDAHYVLLKTGFWTGMINPHPSRFGLSLNSANINLEAASSLQEERVNLRHLAAFAIDSPWSSDPDDAVSIEKTEGSTFLYVHVADPASSIPFDSPAEKEARDRGATLYLPETTVRMLAENAVDLFGLGIKEESPALTFKIRIDEEDGTVKETEIFPSVVKVSRITYEEADKLMEKGEEGAVLCALYDLAKKISERRRGHGAVNIELPDVRIYFKDSKVCIDPIPEYRSSFLVKECMIAAGESAGNWAASRGLSFPYISQEVELQSDHSKTAMSGIAGAIQLRKCMRPRVLSVKPGRHQGLGLDTYTQVTSPLRRYTDLLAHIQIRAFLRGKGILSADEISARLGFCEAGSAAAVHAERASNNHWKMVYLSEKEKDTQWDAITLEEKGNRMSVLIPNLALETLVVTQNCNLPNKKIKLCIKSVNIPKGEAVFTHNA